MAREIERKFLVIGDAWRASARGVRFRQGYLSSRKESTVRVRVQGDLAFLTVKGATVGATRDEFEYPIPVTDAEAMLDRLREGPLVDKIRYVIEYGRRTWEIDEFEGDNA